MPSEISFIPVTQAHRALLLRWLSAPHVREWWGEPEEELALIYDGKGEHEPYLACVNGEPMGYIQAWWPSQHPDLPWQHGMGRDTRGVDLFIGDAAHLNHGFGSAIIEAFSQKLFREGAARLIIDPDRRNRRAVFAYQKAGFTAYDRTPTDLLMERHP